MNQSIMNATCNDYRSEMILLALRRRLEKDVLTAKEREAVQEEISRLEQEMGLD